MSSLEAVASRVLAPFILGESGSVQSSDQKAIVMWALKTAHVSMLVSSDEERKAGYGLPASEYRILYQSSIRDEIVPTSQLWIGRYEGTDHDLAVWVTPLVAHVDGLASLDFPQAYVFTIIIGPLMFHGVRFTTPTLNLDLETSSNLAKIWPTGEPITWPIGTSLDDEAFNGFVKGGDLIVGEPNVALRPWPRATELPASVASGSIVSLPTICGKHNVFYPGILVSEAMRGRFYAFATACECPENYIVITAPDGAHFRYSGRAEHISEIYVSIEGREVALSDGSGVFVCKEL